ncbi:hypothetical protein AGDE_13689 [Angomonas deanei]|nr:hypothetical protein AGDE_13689 [Angomonas deanei]|eukprot:EPY21868.1 hypothetical protein AGDE_13689 [Angomonas deanei]
MLPELKLFVPTGNQTQNTGACRDAFVPAAGANSETQLAAFTFLGKLMGGCMRAEEPMSLVFPPLVWRFLCGVPLTENDLREVDQLTWQAVEEFRRNKASEEEFEAVFDEEYFVARLSDHTVRELIPNGANTKVTYSRSKEYAERLLSARLHEFDEQLLCIREGLVQVIPDFVLLLLTPEELERRVCGKPDYDVEELKKTTIYEGLIAEDRRVALLWTALEEATPLQRRLFLRFVSGRDRLPMRLRLVPLSSQGDPDAVLPKAATCFFALELPDYSSLEVMKTKLFYSIENCADIDTDFEAHVTDIGDNPRLTVGNDTQGDDAPASPNNAST